MLEYKAEKLAGTEPRCRLEQIAADLSDDRERRKVFEHVGEGEALMITEGLLMYLPRAGLMALATEAPQLSGVRYWLLDVFSEQMMSMSGGGNKLAVEHLRPKDHLAGQSILDAAQQTGWTVQQKRTYAEGGAAVAPERTRKLAETNMKKLGLTSVPKDEVSGIYLFAHIARG